MQRDTSISGSAVGRAWRIAGLALAAAVLVGMAAPVRADSDFENGFQDQMGRILAFEAVQAGKALLFQGVALPYARPAYYAPPVAVPVPVPVAVPVPYWQPWYAARGHRPHGYYRGHHGRSHYRGCGH